MKKKILIACTMQIDIIRYIVHKFQIDMPIVWLDRKLHDAPERLHTCIQEQICAHQDTEEILLSYGLCGNAVIGLYSAGTRLVIPSFDDCICQMLYMENDGLITNYGIPEKGCYYLTREWTLDQSALLRQCERIYQDYGSEYGAQIIHEIYAEYRSLVLIDHGAYNIEKIRNYANKAAEYTGMHVKIQKGSCRIMEKLLLGNYDQTICVFEKGERINIRKIKNINFKK